MGGRRESAPRPCQKDGILAKPNYQHEKRRRDLAKKKKQDEKRQRKAEAKNSPQPGENPESELAPGEVPAGEQPVGEENPS